jgi:hypothetical protein
MVLPVVRSRDEAHLYMDLHPCDRCGGVETGWDSALTSDEGEPARRYHGVCAGCQTSREFVFRLPEQPAVSGLDDLVFFGGSEPSQLLDAGEWALVASMGIYDGSAPLTGVAGEDAQRKQSFALGIAAFGEMLKFIPDGMDEVPDSAFWTPRGRAERDRYPVQFKRERLKWRLEGFRLEMEMRFAGFCMSEADAAVAEMDPERSRMSMELARWHDAGQQRHGIDDADWTPEGAEGDNRRGPTVE